VTLRSPSTTSSAPDPGSSPGKHTVASGVSATYPALPVRSDPAATASGSSQPAGRSVTGPADAAGSAASVTAASREKPGSSRTRSLPVPARASSCSGSSSVLDVTRSVPPRAASVSAALVRRTYSISTP
jgi:hypothetical protein